MKGCQQLMYCPKLVALVEPRSREAEADEGADRGQSTSMQPSSVGLGGVQGLPSQQVEPWGEQGPLGWEPVGVQGPPGCQLG
eukprot:2723289-Karenia_brevis.AAC.1